MGIPCLLAYILPPRFFKKTVTFANPFQKMLEWVLSMSADQLIKEIDEKDAILPKDFLDDSSRDQLIQELEEIYSAHKDRLQSESGFKEKYIELVSYVYYWALSSGEYKDKKIFDESLINYLTNNQSSE